MYNTSLLLLSQLAATVDGVMNGQTSRGTVGMPKRDDAKNVGLNDVGDRLFATVESRKARG